MGDSRRGLLTMLAVAALLAAAAAPTTAQDGPVAAFRAGGAGISWQPVVGDYESIALTVTGPGDFVFQRVFTGGENPSFSTFDAEGAYLPDGSYTYELVVQPKLSRSLRKDLQEARDAGVTPSERQRSLSGLPPREALVQSGAFRVLGGGIVSNDATESSAAPVRTASPGGRVLGAPETSALASDSDAVTRDQVIVNDLIVEGSACVGQDCVDGESFGFDTLRLKENNLRIKFDDTSSSASFPNVDWQLTANDSSNGGQNKFSIEDITNARVPFTIEALAPTNSLYVDSAGDVGFGTATPVVGLHHKDGNTPTLRLEQDGSSGFTSQIWDVAGNEANFFVRDVTNGSKLPFRIRPGAPESSIDIAASGNVGMGTVSPQAPLHVRRTSGTAKLLVEEASGSGAARLLLHLKNNGAPQFDFENTATGENWRMINTGGAGASSFIITNLTHPGAELTLEQDGDLLVQGTISSNGSVLNVPDYVFESDYELLPMEELASFVEKNKHLPNVPSAREVKQNGLNHSEFQMRLLEKIEELTLYTLEQERRIADLTRRLASLEEADGKN